MSRRYRGQGRNCTCLDDVENREENGKVQKMQRIGKNMEISRRSRGQGRNWNCLEDLGDREEIGNIQEIQKIQRILVGPKSQTWPNLSWAPSSPNPGNSRLSPASAEQSPSEKQVRTFRGQPLVYSRQKLKKNKNIQHNYFGERLCKVKGNFWENFHTLYYMKNILEIR